MVQLAKHPSWTSNGNLFYIISDDKISSGDWCITIKEAYPSGLPRISKCKSVRENEIVLETGWRKQISYPQSGRQVFKILLTNDSNLMGVNYISESHFRFHPLYEVVNSNEKIILR